MLWWLWFHYFHILALPYFHILSSWPLIFSPESSFLLPVHRETHMESSSPAPERSLTCVKAHRKWVLMFIYSSIMHIQVFHNDSFMKNSLFQNDTTKKAVSRNIKIQQIPEMVWGMFLPWPVCRIQWKAIKVNKNKSRCFFVFFLQARCFNSYSFLLFQSTTTKNCTLNKCPFKILIYSIPEAFLFNIQKLMAYKLVRLI